MKRLKRTVLIYATDNDCIGWLMTYVERTFNKLNDDYRRKSIDSKKSFIKQYNAIVSDGDIVSKCNLRMPETISHSLGNKMAGST